ncbi:uncharacterized protein LOC123210363 [Mangifera indica]|uniref:uncharacterized protein LOC123210363 n=1 Tax=Mangifera indica TaxID=29780 RepID=UPI001CF973B0|nr:uncharacterized protein LOC123210363 [Mangifera indica]XP_044484600.1 uncharacterized protein LOC123210363 [Mangifera indica]
MGLEMESDSDRNSTGLSPNTVLPSPRQCLKLERRNARGKPTHRDDILRVKEGFTEISFHRFCSASCKSTQSRPVGLEDTIELKRGSIYQCSKEVRKIKKMGAIEERKKIELSRSSDTLFSSRVFDSLCNSDEEEESTQKRTSVMSVSSKLKASSVCKSCLEPCPSDGFIEFCLNSDTLKDLNFICDEVAGPVNDGNTLDRDKDLTFQKSHSADCSPSQSESSHSSRAGFKTRFSPIRKMFDPFTKSKSVPSPLGFVVQSDEVVKATGMEKKRRKGTLQKSLLHDFSQTGQNSEFDSLFIKKDQHRSVVSNSPVHLHGLLKIESKQGVPFFEFTLNCPEDFIAARAWKEDHAFNWVYTFHSIDGRKKSNASGWGSSDINKECSVVGQMQVSCYICSELKNGGVFDNSMVTEFVLYDIAHAKQSVISREHKKCSSEDASPKGPNRGFVEGNHELNNESDLGRFKDQPKYASNKSNPCPWLSGDLSPSLEVAAVVIQVPFEKRESLKYRRGRKTSDKMHSNLLNFSAFEHTEKDYVESKIYENVNVIIPSGNHGLPSAESRGPSPLLDRWRFGGGCDCGGWDMACPLTVFSKPKIQYAEDKLLLDNQQPVELFVRGAKDNTPALSMVVLEEGWYAVDFHAQLSTLQAFSICVSILHGTETSVARQEKRMQLPHCNSLKMIIEEEVKFLIEAVTEEEKKKVTRRMEESPQPYVINPPFSPMSRV